MRIPLGRRSALNHTCGRLYENSLRQFGKVKKQYKRFLRKRSKLLSRQLSFFIHFDIFGYEKSEVVVCSRPRSISYICCFIFITSTMYYGIIVQDDIRNKIRDINLFIILYFRFLIMFKLNIISTNAPF